MGSLVERIHGKDDAAVTELLDEAFRDRQFRGCVGRVDRRYVEEAWNAACWSAVRFIQAQEKPHQFDNFDGWFHRTLLRESRRLAVKDADRWEQDLTSDSMNDAPADPGGGPYEAIIDQLQLRHLTDRIARELPRRAERRAFRTHMLTGYRNEELARELDVAPGAARVALHRALASARPITTRVLTTARLAAAGTGSCPELAKLVGGRELPLPDDIWDDVRRHADQCGQCQRTVECWGVPSPTQMTRMLQEVANGRLYAESAAGRAVPQAAAKLASTARPAVSGRGALRAVVQVGRRKATAAAAVGAAVLSVTAVLMLPGEPGAQAAPRLPVGGAPFQPPVTTPAPSARPTRQVSRPAPPTPASGAPSTALAPTPPNPTPRSSLTGPPTVTPPTAPPPSGRPTPTMTPTATSKPPTPTAHPRPTDPKPKPPAPPVAAPDLSGGMSLLFKNMSWLAGTPERSWAITLARGSASQCPTADPCYVPAIQPKGRYWVSAPDGTRLTTYFVLTVSRTPQGWAVHGTDGTGSAGKTDQNYDGTSSGRPIFTGTFVEYSSGHTADMVLTSCATTPTAAACDLLPG